MAATRILLVDDDEIVRQTLGVMLEYHGFEVTAVANVASALKLIIANVYDVLLSDLHMPAAGDGLTVVSAMRHAHPKAATFILTSFPEMEVAAHAILAQTDEILLKNTDISVLVNTIKSRLMGEPVLPKRVESVATILERSAAKCIDDWYNKVELDSRLTSVPLTREQRCGHLPKVFRDLVARLRDDRPLGSAGPLSAAAADHGLDRRKEGYSAAMMVEESRILQVSIFNTLQENLANIDFSILLNQVMIIADEVDSQLRQAMECYVAESLVDGQPA